MEMGNADDDIFNVMEVNIPICDTARIEGICRSQRTWHVWREASGTWDILRAPAKRR